MRLLLGILMTIATSNFAASDAFLGTSSRDETTPLSEQVYFVVSEDGKRWEALNDGKPVLVSDVGDLGVRDSFLVRSGDGKTTWIIATDLCVNRSGDWKKHTRRGSRSIVVWESADLVNWSKPRLVEVAPPEAGCAWAPEAIHDEQSDDYLVFWASTDRSTDYSKHRIWAARTKDFKTFGKPFVYVEQLKSVIDLHIVQDGGQFYRFMKNDVSKAVSMEKATSLMGPWQPVDAFASGTGKNWEGPICYRLPPTAGGMPGPWCLWLDNVSDRIGPGAFGYVPFVSTDPAGGRFEEAKDFQFPYPLRHGSVLRISADELKRLKAAYGATPKVSDRNSSLG